jgi:hypothetical protein
MRVNKSPEGFHGLKQVYPHGIGRDPHPLTDPLITQPFVPLEPDGRPLLGAQLIYASVQQLQLLLALEVLFGLGADGMEVGLQEFKISRLGTLTPKGRNDGISGECIEPPRKCLYITQILAVFPEFEKDRLNQVFGQFGLLQVTERNPIYPVSIVVIQLPEGSLSSRGKLPKDHFFVI